jgi:acyl-CoA thioesterase
LTIEELLGIDGDDVLPEAAWRNQWGAAFGGYVAAVLMNALEAKTPAAHSLSVAHIGFLQPLRAQSPARVSVDVHRSGNSATAMTARIKQAESVVAVATGWALADVEHPAIIDAPAPPAPAPTELARDAVGSAENPFVERDFDMRTVPTPEDPARWLHWVMLRRLGIADDAAWPLAALGLIADMLGGAPYRSMASQLTGAYATIALDLTVHIAAAPRGPWALGAYDSVAVVNGRAIGRGLIYDATGRFAASITQQSLVRPRR